MIKIDNKNIKLWSNIGVRSTFGHALYLIAKKKKNFYVVTGDVSTSAGLDKFRKEFKNNFFDVGIAEQNMIGVASGLSSSEKKVFTTTFSPFQTLRCAEQIKMNLSYMKFPVCMVGLASGISLGTLGYSHCSIEDIGLLRSLPNLTITSPCDTTELIKLLLASFDYNRPMYIRLTGNNKISLINKKNYNFKIGKAIKLIEGKDSVIIGSGTILSECIKAIEMLNLKGIYPALINMHTIKPIDKNMILREIKNKKNIFTVEEHNILGGLGSAVSEVISEVRNNECVLTRIGIKDSYTLCGNYEFMLKQNHLDALSIKNTVVKTLKTIN